MLKTVEMMLAESSRLQKANGWSCSSQLWRPHLLGCDCLSQWFPIFSEALLPLLILERFVPPLWNVHSSPVRVRRLVFTTIGTIVFINANNMTNTSGTKTICYQILALKFVKKNVWYLQI